MKGPQLRRAQRTRICGKTKAWQSKAIPAHAALIRCLVAIREVVAQFVIADAKVPQALIAYRGANRAGSQAKIAARQRPTRRAVAIAVGVAAANAEVADRIAA